MKARPILFSGPMVRALLDGRKTQTRRVLKGTTEYRGPYNPAYLEVHKRSDGWADICPFGKAGDLLWVREGFSYDRLDVDRDGILSPWYWADGNPEYGDWTKPKPSIHMPRWASRLTLELTGIRVERLWDCSESDALAEGVDITLPMFDAAAYDNAGMNGSVYREQYRTVWESINGPGSWDANPRVWVLKFKVHRRNVDELLKVAA